jgi:hypothetical protein
MAGVKPDFECVYITKNCALLYLDELEDALNDGYMELPKDANGEFIHIGDVMEWPDGKAFEVVGIGDGVLFYTENNESADWTGASTKRHHKGTHREPLDELLDDLVEHVDQSILVVMRKVVADMKEQMDE